MVLSERHAETDLDNLGDDWIYVYIYEIADPEGLREGVISEGALRLYSWGEVARMRSLLPESPEEFFERNFALLEKFANEHGHANVPEGHREGRTPLWIWVSNVRLEQLQGRLRPDWAERLEELPGWKWLPGDDFFILDQYARREGHTDVPLSWIEEGRPLGRWVQLQRDDHRKGVLSNDSRRRLEAIPYWHW